MTRAQVTDADSSIIGAIHEFKLPLHNNAFQQSPPRFVIAIPGTVPRESSHKSRGFQIAMQAVKEMVSIAGAANIWLAGHSSGAAIALLAGQNLVESDDVSYIISSVECYFLLSQIMHHNVVYFNL